MTRRALPPIAIVALLGSAAVAYAVLRSRTTAPLNVVVVTLDTTRADRLSPYGMQDVQMPALERLAKEGAMFHRAFTSVPLTLPAHTSLFTGLAPTTTGVRDNADAALEPRFDTLAEILQARGYQTAAFVASAVLQSDRGLGQGFDRYRDIDTGLIGIERAQRRGDLVMNDAIAWLDEADTRPFFLWTHLYDAHRPYDPPEPFSTRISDRYIAEIMFADAQLGRLMDALDRRKLTERTVLVVLADHGESLGDRGERDHGIFLYDNVLRIPLFVRAPGVATRDVFAIARITDVMPTLLEFTGSPSPKIDGHSLLPLLRGEDDQREAYAESLYPRRLGWSAIFALRDTRYKFIEAPRPELYDLESDPFEQRNIAGDRPTVVDAMRRRLATLATSATARETSPVSAELRQRLASLGYLAADPAAPKTPGATLPDPKDCVGAFAAAALDETARSISPVTCR